VPGRAPGGLPHSEIPGSLTASVSPGHFAAWPRPSSAANAKASTMRPSLRSPTSFPSSTCRGLGSRPARARGTIPPARPLAADPRRLWIAPDAVLRRPVSQGDPGAAKGRTGDGVFYSCVVLWLLMQCARATRHELAPHTALGVARSSRHAMSEQDSLVSHGRRTRRVPRGALSRYVRGKNPLVKGGPPCEVVKPRPKPSPDLGRDLPTAAGLRPVLAPVPGWSRGDSNPGPPPCKGGALPAKLRPPESLPPAAASRGGRAWTRTRDLGLIRAAL
jgi:hypothetical protein